MFPAAQAAISNYIASIPVGGTIYKAGIIDAVYGLPGIADVTTTFVNTTTAATHKPTPGLITYI